MWKTVLATAAYLAAKLWLRKTVGPVPPAGVSRGRAWSPGVPPNQAWRPGTVEPSKPLIPPAEPEPARPELPEPVPAPTRPAPTRPAPTPLPRPAFPESPEEDVAKKPARRIPA